MAKGNDFKKPVNNDEIIINEEDEKNKRLIIIVSLSIVVVLGLIIASVSYFNSKAVEPDDKDSDKPNDVIKKPVVDEKPSVDEPTNNDIVITTPIKKPDNNYVAVKPTPTPEEPTPEEPVIEETPVVSSESTDYSVIFDKDSNVAKVIGYSKHLVSADPNFGSGYTNIIKVKVTIDNEKLNSLDDLRIITKTNVGHNIYGKEALDSTDEEIALGNLYFYWLQAVGDGMSRYPTLEIQYGNGENDIYALDLSELTIENENPMLDADSYKIATLSNVDKEGNPIQGNVIGGKDFNYSFVIYEHKNSDEINWKDDAVTTDLTDDASNTNALDPADENNTPDGSGNTGDNNPTEPVRKNKTYTVKFTGEANYYDNGEFSNLGYLDGYHNIVVVKVYVPDDVTEEDIENLTITGVKPNGEPLELKGSDNVNEMDTGNGYVYLYYAVDALDAENPVNPKFVIDWDGTGEGTTTYILDMTDENFELEEAPEKEPEGGDTPAGNQGNNNGSDVTNGGETSGADSPSQSSAQSGNPQDSLTPDQNVNQVSNEIDVMDAII